MLLFRHRFISLIDWQLHFWVCGDLNCRWTDYDMPCGRCHCFCLRVDHSGGPGRLKLCSGSFGLLMFVGDWFCSCDTVCLNLERAELSRTEWDGGGLFLTFFSWVISVLSRAVAYQRLCRPKSLLQLLALLTRRADQSQVVPGRFYLSF